MNDLIILKLGGAAITDKLSEFTLRPDVLAQAFDELSSFSKPLVLVHGAGSFAHNLAKKYLLSKGRDDTLSQEEQFRGITETRRSLHNLHNSVLDEMMKVGMLPISFPVSAIFHSKDHEEMESVYFTPLNHALSLGFVPVLYGDISFDTANMFRVISGDRIIKELCKYFGEKYDSIRILFGSNVDGLFDKDPAIPSAKLIESINKTNIESLVKNAGDSAGTDVTGGMKGKLEEIQSITKLGHRVQIFNLTVPGRLSSILEDRPTIMTDILP